MPSRTEGLPNALIEAMYLERPVVATLCIPIIGRIVKNGINGYLAESENVTSLVSCMEKAVHLRKCKLTYNPSSPNDFLRLFNNV